MSGDLIYLRDLWKKKFLTHRIDSASVHPESSEYNYSMNRKQRRAAQKGLSKKARQQTKELDDSLNRMPGSCDECGAIFDKKNNSALDSWRIAVYDDGPIHLVCPDCVPDNVKKHKREET